MDDEKNQENSGQADLSEHTSYSDGDVISLGSSEVTDGRGRVLKVNYEATIVMGEAGERLAQVQAEAIRNVLPTWRARESSL